MTLPRTVRTDERRVARALNRIDIEDREDRFMSTEYVEAVKELWDAMGYGPRDQLKQLLVHGPTWDGDVISKICRDALLTWKLAVRCCFKGEQGYTAASYLAYTVHKIGTAP